MPRRPGPTTTLIGLSNIEWCEGFIYETTYAITLSCIVSTSRTGRAKDTWDTFSSSRVLPGTSMEHQGACLYLDLP